MPTVLKTLVIASLVVIGIGIFIYVSVSAMIKGNIMIKVKASIKSIRRENRKAYLTMDFKDDRGYPFTVEKEYDYTDRDKLNEGDSIDIYITPFLDDFEKPDRIFYANTLHYAWMVLIVFGMIVIGVCTLIAFLKS